MTPLVNQPTVFVDTSALLAVFDKSDQWHEKAKDYWNASIIESHLKPRILLTDYVIDEAATLIRKRVNHSKAVEVVQLLLDMVERGAFEVLFLNQGRFDAAWEIFKKYNDQDFSFTDCTSFAIWEERREIRAFAFDSHFQTYGIPTEPAS